MASSFDAPELGALVAVHCKTTIANIGQSQSREWQLETRTRFCDVQRQLAGGRSGVGSLQLVQWMLEQKKVAHSARNGRKNVPTEHVMRYLI